MYITTDVRLNNGFSGNKLILGIPTYGRAWKLDEDSGLTGVPPLSTDGAAEPGPYTNEAGLLSYPEICNKIANQKEIQAGYLGKLRKVNDPTKRYGKSLQGTQRKNNCKNLFQNMFIGMLAIFLTDMVR